MWTVIPGRGNSSSSQRIALMRRYLRLFDASTIRLLLADRELSAAPGSISCAKTTSPSPSACAATVRVTTAEGHELTLDARLHWRRRSRGSYRLARHSAEAGGHRLSFRQAPRDGEWLILATNARPPLRLDAYRKRWPIECLFGDARPAASTSRTPGLTDSAQARPLDGPRRAGHCLGGARRARPPRHPMAKAKIPRIPRKILVPNRIRPDPPPPQIRPTQSNRAMAPHRPKTHPKRQSRECGILVIDADIGQMPVSG